MSSIVVERGDISWVYAADQSALGMLAGTQHDKRNNTSVVDLYAFNPKVGNFYHVAKTARIPSYGLATAGFTPKGVVCAHLTGGWDFSCAAGIPLFDVRSRSIAHPGTACDFIGRGAVDIATPHPSHFAIENISDPAVGDCNRAVTPDGMLLAHVETLQRESGAEIGARVIVSDTRSGRVSAEISLPDVPQTGRRERSGPARTSLDFESTSRLWVHRAGQIDRVDLAKKSVVPEWDPQPKTPRDDEPEPLWAFHPTAGSSGTLAPIQPAPVQIDQESLVVDQRLIREFLRKRRQEDDGQH
jgi:hypothetical protein